MPLDFHFLAGSCHKISPHRCPTEDLKLLVSDLCLPFSVPENVKVT